MIIKVLRVCVREYSVCIHINDVARKKRQHTNKQTSRQQQKNCKLKASQAKFAVYIFAHADQ